MQRFFEITTPQNVEFRFRIAGLASRALAFWLDTLILLFLAICGSLLLALFTGPFFPDVASAGIIVLIFVLHFGYMVFFETVWSGQTPGKRLMRLRVLRANGTPADFRAILVRNLLRLIDGQPGLAFFEASLIGALVASCNSLTQRLGDLAADTVVVEVPRTRIPFGYRPLRDGYNSLRDQPLVVERIRRSIDLEERELILDLCVRGDQLALVERSRLFAQVASDLTARLALEEVEHLSQEKLVQNVADILLDEHQHGSGVKAPGASAVPARP